MLAQSADVSAWLLDQAPTVVIMAYALWMFVTGRIHSDKEFLAERQDKLFYRAMALKSADAAVQATSLAEKVANGSPEVRP